ncbi:uncharacterized protein LOC143916634 [Arctopsyche grandis]|uniref:uncharacterized protein LOC143916634 n=1 Tax=Arctopsyche grandis TaxID=121162 RepID=UPI00406D9BA3
MAQGKMKVKSKLPDNVKNKKTKGSAITKRSNAPIQSKKKNIEETHRIKKIISKNVNKKMEEEIRSRATDRKSTLSNAQKAMVAHNAAKSNVKK